MPWFITAIYSNIRSKNDIRCFGFFNNYNDAYDAIVNNKGDLHEALYEYLVVEYIEQGIHPEIIIEKWWAWNMNMNEWIELEKRPFEFEKYGSNWALG
jgi:hypothetical protein